VYRQVAGGGGGFGDPRRRPVDKVAEEVRFGLVSVQAARDAYGVVVDTDGRIDRAATEDLRKKGQQ
ncbi:hypothetical protein ACFQ07_22770, partial [Actinomadura adrarensis]